MSRFKVFRGLVQVKARSSIHDTVTKYEKLSGSIEFDPDEPRAAQAQISVDMRVFDAGDRFKNWKIKSDLDPDAHPTATFRLTVMNDVHETSSGRFKAKATGQLEWRGKTVDLTVNGTATVDRRGIEATATFELDVKKLGISPPKFLMFKVEDEVVVQVSLFATIAAS